MIYLAMSLSLWVVPVWMVVSLHNKVKKIKKTWPEVNINENQK